MRFYLALAQRQLGRTEEAEIILARLAGRSAMQREADLLLRQMARPTRDERAVARLEADDWLNAFFDRCTVSPNPTAPVTNEAEAEEAWENALALARRGGTSGSSALLRLAHANGIGHDPLVYYHLAAQETRQAKQHLERLHEAADPTYCFPSRLEDLAVLTEAATKNRHDWLARLLLGNLLAYLGRNDEAFAVWQEAAHIIETRKRPGIIRAVLIPPTLATLYRNLGLALSLWHNQPREGLAWYDKAIALNPDEYHLHLERDQLVQKAGLPAKSRLKALERASPTVAARWEIAARRIDCLVTLKRWPEALELLTSYSFKPWEGARSMHSLWAATQVGLAEGHAAQEDWGAALDCYEQALAYPPNLGVGRLAYPHEAKLHWLAAEAAGQAGDQARQQQHLSAAADEPQRAITEASLYKLKALRALKRDKDATELSRQLREWAAERLRQDAADPLAAMIEIAAKK